MILNIDSLPQPLMQGVETIRSLSEEEIDKGMATFIEIIHNDTEQALQQLNVAGQQTIKFCCFSESIKSPTMWGIYASDESGFALEYDFSKIQRFFTFLTKK